MTTWLQCLTCCWKARVRYQTRQILCDYDHDELYVLVDELELFIVVFFGFAVWVGIWLGLALKLVSLDPGDASDYVRTPAP